MVKRPLGFTCLVVSLILCFLVSIESAPDMDYSDLNGKEVTVTGRVSGKEIIRQEKESVTVLYVTLLSAKQQEGAFPEPLGKKAVCYLKSGQQEPEMGSSVRLTGKFAGFERASNPGQFDAYSFYQILGISYRLNQAVISAKSKKFNIVTQAVYQMRCFFSRKFKEQLPEREAALMQTMLLGEKQSMDKELKALYQRNGIAHVLAISGLHISMLGMGLYKLLKKIGIPIKAAAVFSTGIIFFYGGMTGFSVSAVRAVIMFSFHMAAILAERTCDTLTAVSAAAVLLLFRQPLYLFHSGFIFSFSCVLGIELILPALTIKHKETGTMRHFMLQGILRGLGMMVVTLPVYLWFYYQFPIYSVFLNFLIIPLMSFLMAAGLLLLLCSILCPWASFPFVLMIKGILIICESSCGICDKLPGSLLTTGKPESWQIGVYLLALFFIVLSGKKRNLFLRWMIAAAAILVLTIPVKRGLKITFLDVGQGDCICIENSHGNNYLVDGGSSSVSNVGRYRMIPFLKSQGISTLEAVFITHPDEDHCNGIRELMETGALQGIFIKHLVLPDIAGEGRGEAYRELEGLAEKSGIPVSYISKGQKIADGGLTIECLHPARGYQGGDANEYSIVFSVTYGNFEAMLTGDIEGAGEQKLTQFLQEEGRKKRITVLKAAHHGSKWSTPDTFLDSQMPLYTVISCGKGNSYGHPHKELLSRLEKHNTDILITYEKGAVSFCTDGERVEVRKFSEQKR